MISPSVSVGPQPPPQRRIVLNKFLQRAKQVPGYGHAYVLRPGVSHARHCQGCKAAFPGCKIPRLDLRHFPHVPGERGQCRMMNVKAPAKALQTRHGNALPGNHGERVYRYVMHK